MSSSDFSDSDEDIYRELAIEAIDENEDETDFVQINNNLVNDYDLYNSEDDPEIRSDGEEEVETPMKKAKYAQILDQGARWLFKFILISHKKSVITIKKNRGP